MGYVDNLGKTSGDRAELQEKIRRVNEDAKLNWYNDQWHREMAQQMAETILEGFEHENLLQLMTTVENAPFDGRIFVKEVRGLRAHWVARGGYIEASNMNQEVMELRRDTIGFHVYEMEDKVQTQFAETQSDMITLGQQRLNAEVNLRVLALFQASIQSGSPYYITGAGVSLSALNTAIREVRDESLTPECTIIGRATMVQQIMDQVADGSSFYPESNEQVLQRGVLGTYRGCRIVELKNYKDDGDVSFFPANEMYVVARDASKFAFWGGMMFKEYTEQDAWYWHYIARRDFGGVVHRPERLRRIIDSSISA